MYKKSLLLFVLLAAMGMPQAAQLYRNVSLKTVGVQDQTQGNVVFWIQTDAPPIENPNYHLATCHTGPQDRVIWDLNGDASKAALSLALTAYTANFKVDIDTYDTCIDGMATVRNIYFSPNQ